MVSRTLFAAAALWSLSLARVACAEEDCGDSVDNDGDGRIDCDDTDCCGEPQCVPSPDCFPFRRGDVNDDGKRNVTDAVRLLTHLFAGETRLVCPKAADVDDSGALELTDAVLLLEYLFLHGPEPPLPFLNCGIDPTPDHLQCFASCTG